MVLEHGGSRTEIHMIVIALMNIFLSEDCYRLKPVLRNRTEMCSEN